MGVMRKLNEKKIQWIIREIEKGRKITEIAEIQGTSRVRVWHGSCTDIISEKERYLNLRSR